MPTKRYYANQLQEVLYPSTTGDAKFDIQTAMVAVGQAAAKYVKIEVLRNKAFTRTVYGNWVGEYEAEIKYDETKKRYYTKLPVDVVSLPKDQGVYLAHYSDTPQESFIPVPIGFLSATRGSLASNLEGKTGYMLVEDKLVYVQEMQTDCKVTLYLIPDHSQLDENDYFPIDGSAIDDVMKFAAEIYMVQKGINEDIRMNNISE